MSLLLTEKTGKLISYFSDTVRLGATYNRTKFLKERRVMMQRWADYLDRLKRGAVVLTLHDVGNPAA